MKKGFTLIELLAVIVVLAIISVIAIPTLIGVVNKVRLNSLKSSAYGLIESGNLYYAQNGSNNYRFDIAGSSITSNDTDRLLSFKGNVKQGTVIVSNKGQITVCVTDGVNSAYKNYNDTEVSLVSKKTCTIPSNTYIVYLDGTATRSELSNQELTDAVNSLVDRVNALEDENKTLKTQINNVAKNNIYPVGSVYISVNNENPATLFGGTWEKIEDRFLLSSGTNYTLGSTGGNSSVLYTPQGTVGNHTLTVAEMPKHNHSLTINVGWGSGVYGSSAGNASQNNPQYLWGGSIGYSGGNQAHNHPFTGTQANINIMNPYIVVNIWKRTA